MAVDTPARIAVVGAGPIGLEAAIYARYLGYSVDVYERGRVAEHLLRWGHVRLFTPWQMNVSSLGAAALRAQDEAWQPARADELLTCRELVDRYFLPLANSDLLSDGVQERTEVVAVAREGMLQADFVGDERRADVPFRLLLRDADGAERFESADVVLDCSGTLSVPNHLGSGGLPAAGELTCREQIEHEIPDIAGADRDRYRGRHTLVVGGGHAAATTVTSLAALSADDPATRITWVVRRDATDGGPIAEVADDPFPDRAALAAKANLLAAQPSGPVEFLPQTNVESIAFDEASRQFHVELGGGGGGHRTFDHIVANVGHRADARLYAELQAEEPPFDGVALTEPLAFAEPDFYVLGAKSFGRATGFNLAIGREQIRVLFAILGDREGLNLYATH
jgi:cation diffusion facilitator CzcD-associated flavoprotein CzcO